MKNRMLKLLRILLVLALVTSCLWAITGCRKNAEAPDPDPNNQGSANDTEAYSGAGVNESSAPAPAARAGRQARSWWLLLRSYRNKLLLRPFVAIWQK